MEPLYTQTPLSLTPDIIRECAKVVPDPHPFFIAVNPLPWCEALQCFPNVERQISEKGGRIQYGWLVQIFPRVLMEFEFHAIWLQNDETPVDITPSMPHCPGGVAETVHLFLPDNKKTYTGKRV